MWSEVQHMQQKYENPSKSGFSSGCMVCMRVPTSFKNDLFYSKRKVWTISEKMSTVGAPCDKNSLLSIGWNIFDFFHFSRFWWKMLIRPRNVNFFENMLQTTAASFYVTELIWCSIDAIFSVLSRKNKIWHLKQFFRCWNCSRSAAHAAKIRKSFKIRFFLWMYGLHASTHKL